MVQILVLVDAPEIPGYTADDLREIATEHLAENTWLPAPVGQESRPLGSGTRPNDVTVAVVESDRMPELLFAAAREAINARGHAAASYGPANVEDVERVLDTFQVAAPPLCLK